MDTNRHEFFAPKAFGALECGGLTPLSEARLVITHFVDNLCGELRGRPWATCWRRNLGEGLISTRQRAAPLSTQANKVQRVCAKCGATIFADAPKGLCSLCLFNAEVAPLLEEALDPAQVPTKFGDFQIARREDGSLWELGHGGMGVTYRARVSVLHRSVALKNNRGHTRRGKLCRRERAFLARGARRSGI